MPTQRTGAPASGEAPIPIPRIADPDAAGLERLVRDAERDAKQAAQRLVDAQNALEAQRQRAELRERVAGLEIDVQARDDAIAKRDQLIESERLAAAETITASQSQRDSVQQQLGQTESQLETMGVKFAEAAHALEEALTHIGGLESDYAAAQDEIAEEQGVIVILKDELVNVNGVLVLAEQAAEEQYARANQAEAQRDQALQSAAAQTARAEQAESARDALQERLSAESAMRAKAEAARDQAQQQATATDQALASEKAERKQERGLFEQLKAGYVDTINAIKDQLQIVKDQLLGVTGNRDKLRDEREKLKERVREAMTEVQRIIEIEKAQKNEIEILRTRLAASVVDAAAGDGGKAKPQNPPGKI